MGEIYILREGKLIIGPFNLKKIKKRGLKISDKVWYEGLYDWTPVEELSHLAPCIVATGNRNDLSFFQRVFSFLK
ncbi:MAG: DUF4339 domain-containing protein [Sphingobacteriales bacterium]|uniref:GYF domain-containing protein n=1 Tax=Hydrotalea flava TaxID=714549 RepID=UPI00083446D7|nr:GYF domain-containing protein [Hydrotalea flava]RTL53269.1 MAG: DUF4339 domain-containing protein [Sphingobacteriales bacterium]